MCVFVMCDLVPPPHQDQVNWTSGGSSGAEPREKEETTKTKEEYFRETDIK